MSLSKEIWHWAFYDFANSSYILIYQSFLLPIFFSTILLQHGYTLSSWGWANGISTLIGVILAIIIGYFADRYNRFYPFMVSIIITFVGMIAVALSVQYFVNYLYTLFIATNSFFILSLALSDSILPYVASKKDSYHFGGFAWGFGYIGGIISLIIVLGLQKVTYDYSPWVFLSVAIFYLIFSIYALLGLKKVPLNEPVVSEVTSPLSKSRKGMLFLGYWLISECITVILLFFSIFGSQELHLSTAMLGAFLLLVQVIAFPATWYGGYLTKRFHPLSLLGVSIVCWGVTIGLLISQPSIWLLVLATIFAGLAVGNSQSFLRSQYSTLINKSESGLQFGMYSLVSEAAVFIGPILYGYASDSLHSQRIPLMILFLLMVIGYGLVRYVIKKTHIPL